MKKSFKVSPETKEQILARVKEGNVPVSQIAEEHGISSNTIYNWLKGKVKAQPGWKELSKLQKENKALLELVGELTVKLSQTQKKN